jgi:hypothetical protein
MLLEYPSFYTDFKQDAPLLEPTAVWYSKFVLHKFPVGWFPLEMNSISFFSCVKTNPLLPLSFKSFDIIKILYVRYHKDTVGSSRVLASKFKIQPYFWQVISYFNFVKSASLWLSWIPFLWFLLRTPIHTSILYCRSNLPHIFWFTLGQFIVRLFKFSYVTLVKMHEINCIYKAAMNISEYSHLLQIKDYTNVYSK